MYTHKTQDSKLPPEVQTLNEAKRERDSSLGAHKILQRHEVALHVPDFLAVAYIAGFFPSSIYSRNKSILYPQNPTQK